MNLTTKQLKEIVAEELRSLLSEQSLRGYLTAQGMSEEEMMDMMSLPGGMAMLNLIREFEFQSLQGTGMPRWQREVMWERGTHKDLEIQTITLYGKHGAGFKRHGPRWEKGPSWRKTFRERHYDDYEEAATEIAKLITPPKKEMFMGQLMEEDEAPKASHRAKKIAELMMEGQDQFETVANYIRMGVVPMEDIQKAIVEKYNETLPQLTDAEHIRKAGYDSYADPNADTDVDAIRKANHEIEILKIPFYNVFQFWFWATAPDSDGSMASAPDIKQEVDNLLDIQELHKMVPGLKYYYHGGEGSGIQDPFFEHMINEEMENVMKERLTDDNLEASKNFG